jgi:hypothetical protein
MSVDTCWWSITNCSEIYQCVCILSNQLFHLLFPVNSKQYGRGAAKIGIKYMDKVMLGLIVIEFFGFPASFHSTKCFTFINCPVIDAEWSCMYCVFI